MNLSITELLGYSAGLLTTLTFLPQVIKTWRDRTARDISLAMFVIAAVNEVMWIGYGVLKDDMVIIVTNAIVLLMSCTMIVFKLKFR